jgi:LacI family transcriptional regulator
MAKTKISPNAATVTRMRDVARAAGVSTMTVSRVLNNAQYVTEEVRQRVLNATQKLNYQPNDVARLLRAQRSRQIGMIVPFLYDPFFAIASDVVGRLAKKNGYSMMISTSNEDPVTEFDEAWRMSRRSVEGLIVSSAPVARGKSLLTSPKLEGLPIVAFDRPVDKSYDSVIVENAEGMRMATQHLIEHGHERIAYIGLHSTLYTMSLRQQGYEGAMKTWRLKPQSVQLSGAFNDSLVALTALMNSRNRPTAFVTANNVVTRHILHALAALRLKVPQDAALVGFDDFETADLLVPGITVVRQPIEELARLAAETLFARLSDPQGALARSPREIVLPVELVRRGSCGGGAGHHTAQDSLD